jgi:hypothetical protein
MTRLLLCAATILALTASAMAQRENTMSNYFGVPNMPSYNYGNTCAYNIAKGPYCNQAPKQVRPQRIQKQYMRPTGTATAPRR